MDKEELIKFWNLDHEDTKTENLQQYDSSNSTTTPPLSTMDRKQTNVDNK